MIHQDSYSVSTHAKKQLAKRFGVEGTMKQFQELGQAVDHEETRIQYGIVFVRRTSNEGEVKGKDYKGHIDLYRVNLLPFFGIPGDGVCVFNPSQRRIISIMDTRGHPLADGGSRSSTKKTRAEIRKTIHGKHQPRHVRLEKTRKINRLYGGEID